MKQKFQKEHENRRKLKRTKTKEGLFALVNQPYHIIGEITDISENGLAFRYSLQKKEPSVLSQLNILRVEDNLQISLPVKPKWDSIISKTYRKKGVQFGRLSNRQRSQLQSILS